MIRDQIESGEVQRLGAHTPIPAARPLSDFAVEQVGDDLVVFDCGSMQYHTLNGVARTIWRACDGVSTIEAVAVSASLPVDVVETTIAELGEASLLVTPANTWSVSMSRRRAAKLIAAGAVGAVGVPVVLSITAPSHQAAATDLPTCANDNTLCPPTQVGQVMPNCHPESGWATVTCCWSAAPGQGGPYWRAGAVGFCVPTVTGRSAGFEQNIDDVENVEVSSASFTEEQQEILNLGQNEGTEPSSVTTNAGNAAPEVQAPAPEVQAPASEVQENAPAQVNSDGGNSELVETSNESEDETTPDPDTDS